MGFAASAKKQDPPGSGALRGPWRPRWSPPRRSRAPVLRRGVHGSDPGLPGHGGGARRHRHGPPSVLPQVQGAVSDPAARLRGEVRVGAPGGRPVSVVKPRSQAATSGTSAGVAGRSEPGGAGCGAAGSARAGRRRRRVAVQPPPAHARAKGTAELSVPCTPGRSVPVAAGRRPGSGRAPGHGPQRGREGRRVDEGPSTGPPAAARHQPKTGAAPPYTRARGAAGSPRS